LLKRKTSDHYEDKKRMLMNNHIAVWDVVHSCRRNGSLDSNLKDVKTNDFKYFFEEHSTLRAVFFNGQTAYKLFKRHNDDITLPAIVLPSTSPAYTLFFGKKLIQWRKILEFIQTGDPSSCGPLPVGETHSSG
jgi:hypoxanthine-DNA glycosylase